MKKKSEECVAMSKFKSPTMNTDITGETMERVTIQESALTAVAVVITILVTIVKVKFYSEWANYWKTHN
jgi:hypothetical protein